MTNLKSQLKRKHLFNVKHVKAKGNWVTENSVANVVGQDKFFNDNFTKLIYNILKD